jgi:glycosyltransferase involved in cell wall biosynthesis
MHNLNLLKISIITVTYNSVETILDCLNSIQSQTYPNIEHIVIDGGSEDGTIELLKKNHKNIDYLLIEMDNGIYDALNKGFSMASGGVVGIMHSDDTYYDESVLERVALLYKKPNIDFVYGDINMVDNFGVTKRYWKTGELKGGRIFSNQIPHPTLFLSKKLVDKLIPPFDDSYKIAADLKQQLIIVNILCAEGAYIKAPLVNMRIGGTSTKNLSAYVKGWFESRRAWNEVHGRGGAFYVFKKIIFKIQGIKGFFL